MEIRELRYFVALAEELHFARAAARVGIEQSPLSKAISEFERQLGVRLFVRTRRSTTLTRVGEALLQDARRILSEVAHARRSVMAAASGCTGCLRIALGDGLAHPRLAELLAQSRSDDPGVDYCVAYHPPSEHVRWLCSGTVDIAITLRASDSAALHCIPLWSDPAVTVLQAHGDSSEYAGQIQAQAALSPVFLLESSMPGAGAESDWILRLAHQRKVEYVGTVDLLLTLVAAGYGTGVLSAAQAEIVQRRDLIFRPWCRSEASITTYMLSRNEDRSALTERFRERAQCMGRTLCI